MDARNSQGKPLSSNDWLEDHHFAKYEIREKFARTLMALKPSTIVDIGCGSGLWLQLLDKVTNDEVNYIGIDCDQSSLDLAQFKLGKSLTAMCEHIESALIPTSDMCLAFNILPYIDNVDLLIHKVYESLPSGGVFVVRQYDGASLRFGPMVEDDRLSIEESLYSSISSSKQIHHYDMDRVFEALNKSKFENVSYNFETTSWCSPYSNETESYIRNMLNWTYSLVNDRSKMTINKWLDRHIDQKKRSYFYEVDLVSIATKS